MSTNTLICDVNPSAFCVMALHLLRSNVWLQRCAAPRYSAPFRPHCIRYMCSNIDTRAIAQQLMHHYPNIDPTNIVTKNFEVMLQKIPGVDNKALQPQLLSLAKVWKELYEESMFDDLLDSDFGVTGIRPELGKRAAEDEKMYSQASSEGTEAEGEALDPKKAKALRFQQYEKENDAESLQQQVIETACEEVEREAEAKIEEINANAKRHIKEIERNLASKRAKIIRNLKESFSNSRYAAASAATTKAASDTSSPLESATIKRKSGERPKWGKK